MPCARAFHREQKAPFWNTRSCFCGCSYCSFFVSHLFFSSTNARCFSWLLSLEIFRKCGNYLVVNRQVQNTGRKFCSLQIFWTNNQGVVISNTMTEMKRLIFCSQISKQFNLPSSSCLPTRMVGDEYLVKTNGEGLSCIQTSDAVRAANWLNVLN